MSHAASLTLRVNYATNHTASFSSRYIKDECRVHRWTYEDSIPLSMETNMKYMLKTASNRIAFCQNDKEKRGEMLNDLNELSTILDGKWLNFYWKTRIKLCIVDIIILSSLFQLVRHLVRRSDYASDRYLLEFLFFTQFQNVPHF